MVATRHHVMSIQGEARRRYEDAVGLKRKHQKLAVNLPPMLNTREGKLLGIEVRAFEDFKQAMLSILDQSHSPRAYTRTPLLVRINFNAVGS